MTPILLVPPALEPIDPAEAKAWLRVDGADEDGLIAALVTTARMQVERSSRRCLIDQTWRIVADRWPPGGRIALPLAPVRSVVEIRVFDAAGTATVLPAAAYRLEALREPQQLVFTGPLLVPGRATGGIEIDLVCGFGPASGDVPEPLRHAIRLLVARWYEHRGDTGGDQAALPAEVQALVAATRRPRLA